jgi:uncharacterized protein YdiU (UPF0061 family)
MKNIQFMKSLKDLKFENSQLKHLFIKEVKNPKKSQQTPQCNYTKVTPTPLTNPKLISLSKPCATFLGLDYQKALEEKETTAEYLSGNKILEGSIPIAHCYCGHQFGIFAGQLGDGRAITLGDVWDTDKRSLWEIQLKGSGLTPYSRFADGRAVLRSSIREYLCSEHLWALGIPTTRALSLVGSNNTVDRDPLYTGNVIKEQCCVVSRIAPSFFRFGSFEIFKDYDSLTGHQGPSVGLEKEMIEPMLDYIAKFHFKDFWEEHQNNKPALYMHMFKLIVIRTAVLAAYWQSYGFCHGVLNTDNMSILGLTIDFGPFGFLEYFDPAFICNHSDRNGRYSYARQTEACKWNLMKLSESWDYCLKKEESSKIVEEIYDKTYEAFYYLLNQRKLGLFSQHDHDKALIDELYSIINDFGFDLTLFFRNLSEVHDESSCDAFIEKIKNYSLPFSIKLQKTKPQMSEDTIKTLLNLKKCKCY